MSTCWQGLGESDGEGQATPAAASSCTCCRARKALTRLAAIAIGAAAKACAIRCPHRTRAIAKNGQSYMSEYKLRQLLDCGRTALQEKELQSQPKSTRANDPVLQAHKAADATSCEATRARAEAAELEAQVEQQGQLLAHAQVQLEGALAKSDAHHSYATTLHAQLHSTQGMLTTVKRQRAAHAQHSNIARTAFKTLSNAPLSPSRLLHGLHEVWQPTDSSCHARAQQSSCCW